MRIVIDLQGAQSHSRLRGIGRYSLSLAQAIVRNRGEHDIVLVLSALLPEAIVEIRQSFEGLLDQDHILVWHAPGPVQELNPHNALRRRCAEQIREAFIASLDPDLVHIMSLFEGFGDDAITSIGEFDRSRPVSVILYDLIPLVHAQHYLAKNPSYESYYQQKIAYLKRATLCLAISEASRQEGMVELGLSDERVVNISTAGEPHFCPVMVDEPERLRLQACYGITRPFVMYTGGIDYRKNVEGLIRAYRRLPQAIRLSHQLLIVCSLSKQDQERLLVVIKKEGLTTDDVVLTARVPEADLVHLYNLCTLFVFPSFHEGFGLPVLEAMACGAPVIASNTSSLPEVVGNSAALFDPFEDEAIATKIAQVLGDKELRSALIAHGLVQARQFSWDRSARLAIEAWEHWHHSHKVSQTLALSSTEKFYQHQTTAKPTMAFVSPLPPAKSGISDYSAQLLPQLATHYQIDVIALQEQIADPWVLAHCPVRSVDWFLEHHHQFDRVLYHFGNSTVHGPLFELLYQVPGVVVLHDFFLSGLVAEQEATLHLAGNWAKILYQSHGYKAVFERYHVSDTAQVVWDYPCNLAVLQNALGVIVHSDHSRQLLIDWYGQAAGTLCQTIPLLRVPPNFEGRKEDKSQSSSVMYAHVRSSARASLGIAPNDFVVCSFGMLGKSKLNELLLQAWNASALASSLQCRLIFVGECADAVYGQDLEAMIAQSPLPTQIQITGWTSAEQFTQYLEAADIAVQLRSRSRGETSAAVLDCLNYGLPTIVNAHGSMATFSKEQVYQLSDHFTQDDLSAALHALWIDPKLRQVLSHQGRLLIHARHSPTTCASDYVRSIEQFYERSAVNSGALQGVLGALLPSAQLDTLGRALAQSIAQTFAPKYRQRQILIDISELVTHDSKTGIQRVVRSVLNQWIHHPPAGFRIEPVYASEQHGYRYARRYTLAFLGCPEVAATQLADEPVEFYAGDRFIGLDLQPNVVKNHAHAYRLMRQQGVRVQFVVYDLLPFLMPQFFYPGADRAHQDWLNVAAQSDSLLCISRAVAKEVIAWKQSQNPIPPCEVSWFHLGADMKASVPSKGLPKSSVRVLQALQEGTSFLMVGTLEPRKSQESVVRAFELLWEAGENYCLVIVGKPGWLNERFIECLEHHPSLNERLFWLDAISDEYLEQLYHACDCLIAASEGEGFGLPLIEAAQHQLPIIARDIPVFREVAGENAFYFASSEPQSIALAIKQWITLYAQNQHPQSGQVKFLTWEQSAQQLLELVLPERQKPQLAFISPLPSEHTGIADYAGDLLPDLASEYDITLIHEAFAQEPNQMLMGLPVRSLSWFENHADQFDRIIYQFGNSPFHLHMLALLRRHPGIVVLHDFFLSGLWEYCELAAVDPYAWSDALYYSHGYTPLLRRFVDKQTASVRNAYPANLEVLDLARSVIVHSEHARKMAHDWYGQEMGRNWHCIPLVRTPPKQTDRQRARSALGIGEHAFVVCSFGFAAPTKLSLVLVNAWFASHLAADPQCHLYLVGQNHGGEYGNTLAQSIVQNPFASSVTITGWVDKLEYEQYLQAADLAVQLRCDSRGETSAAVLDCLNFGLPTIINRHGSMAEIDSQAAYILEDVFTQSSLTQALELLRSDDERREELHLGAIEKIRYEHHPRTCAALYCAAIEAATTQHVALASPAWRRNLPNLASLSSKNHGEVRLTNQTQSVAPIRQLLVDVTEIVRSDLRSGIERVVRAQLAQFLAYPPAGFRVEPIYLDDSQDKVQYRYARNYVSRLYDFPLPTRPEFTVQVVAGDIFYGADFCPLDVVKAAKANIYQTWRQAGVKISFVVYDLLPIALSEFFPPTVDDRHKAWLACIVGNADQLIAISKAVATDVQQYIDAHLLAHAPDLQIDFVHQGADISASFPSAGLPQTATAMLEKISSKPTFLMVGTIEPRKGILQALAAFEQLWAKGEDVQLLLVGKEGWLGLQPEQRRTLPKIIQTLRDHSELSKRLLWISDCSDQYLQKIYSVATCLLMASEGEGFGLPLIEAAAHQCPILTRDLPVFREIAGPWARYFLGNEPDNISAAIEDWLRDHSSQEIELPDKISYLSWQENAAQVWQLLQKL